MNEYPAMRIRLPFLLAFLTLGVLILFSFMPHSAVSRPAADADMAALRVAEPEIAAHAYLVRFVGSPAPIIKRREGKRLAPASLTKLMTAVVARERLARAEGVVFSRDAKTVEQKTSSARTGEAFARDDAIRMALMASYNDAALALAEAAVEKNGDEGFAGRITAFVGLMNKKASEIRMLDTHFENPTGLDQDGHYASAEDLARLSEYAFVAHPEMWEILRTAEAVVYSDGKTPHAIQSSNELLREFPALRGGKTGFTDRAQGALILLYPARTRGTAIIVILGSPDRFGDGRRIIRWLEANAFGG